MVEQPPPVVPQRNVPQYSAPNLKPRRGLPVQQQPQQGVRKRRPSEDDDDDGVQTVDI